jgi:hypothetical protein
MYLDALALYCEDQAITATADSTNAIDHSVANPIGDELVEVFGVVTETFATLTSLTAALETDDNDSFSSGTDVLTSGAVAAATLVKGYEFSLGMLPKDQVERYTQMKFTVGGSNATAGKVTFGLRAGRR